MDDSAAGDITGLLRRASDGDAESYDKLMPLVYEQLRRLAARCVSKERREHTLQPTALVHEAYMRLVDQTRAQYQDRTHFLAIAARVMRNILTDYARRRRAAKRGGNALRVTLNEARTPATQRDVNLVALDEALDALERMDARKSRVVELRFFGGLTNDEAARVLKVSPKTSEADWYMARAWLRRALREDDES